MDTTQKAALEIKQILKLNSSLTGVEFLNQKAIPNSRGKNALAMLKRKEAERMSQSDPFQKRQN